MKWQEKFLNVFLIFIAVGIIAFNVLIYNFCEVQKASMTTMVDEQKAQTQDNAKEFKYQQDQIAQLGRNLRDIQDQIKDQHDDLGQQKDALSQQKDAFLQEVQKRQQLENENKNVQKSLMDIEAEADAIKDNMKGWQKDYVSVLAELEKKMDASQEEIKSLESDISAINIPELRDSINSLRAQVELLNHPVVNDSTSSAAQVPAPLTDDKKT